MPSKTINLLPDEIPVFRKILDCYPARFFEEGHIAVRCTIGESVVTLYKSGKVLIQGNDADSVYDKLMGNFGEGEVVIGIDEVGRGEDYGPFVIAGVKGDRNKFRLLRDSKKIRNIAEYHKIVEENADESEVVEVPAAEIDKKRRDGFSMNQIEALAIGRIVKELRKKGEPVLVDGKPISVDVEGIEFIKGGDDIDPVISAASILAKHIRNISADKEKRKTWKTNQ